MEDIRYSGWGAGPDFLYAALDTTARAVFFKENRMKRPEATSLTGNQGAPSIDPALREKVIR